MKIKFTLAAFAATALVASAATTVIDTTTNVYSTNDRGDFPLANTGQTFTTGSLGTDMFLSVIQLQESRDYPKTDAPENQIGDVLTLEIWTDIDGDHATWDPGVKLGTSTNTATFGSTTPDSNPDPGVINNFLFSGVPLDDNTVYAIRYISNDASGDNLVRFAVTKNSASPGVGGTYKDGTLFADGATPFSNGWDSGFSVQTVPEPSAAALLGLGGLALILRRRK